MLIDVYLKVWGPHLASSGPLCVDKSQAGLGLDNMTSAVSVAEDGGGGARGRTRRRKQKKNLTSTRGGAGSRTMTFNRIKTKQILCKTEEPVKSANTVCKRYVSHMKTTEKPGEIVEFKKRKSAQLIVRLALAVAEAQLLLLDTAALRSAEGQ